MTTVRDANTSPVAISTITQLRIVANKVYLRSENQGPFGDGGTTKTSTLPSDLEAATTSVDLPVVFSLLRDARPVGTTARGEVYRLVFVSSFAGLPPAAGTITVAGKRLVAVDLTWKDTDGATVASFQYHARISYTALPISAPAGVVPYAKLPTGQNGLKVAAQQFVRRIHEIYTLNPKLVSWNLGSIQDAESRLPADVHVLGLVTNLNTIITNGRMELKGPSGAYCIQLSLPAASVAHDITPGVCLS